MTDLNNEMTDEFDLNFGSRYPIQFAKVKYNNGEANGVVGSPKVSLFSPQFLNTNEFNRYRNLQTENEDLKLKLNIKQKEMEEEVKTREE